MISRIPDYVNLALETLKDAGHQCFIVGGCVRDLLMEKEPADWDLCTSAKPDQIKEAFRGYKTIDTGIRHGTVAVLIRGNILEITTYRIDGEYLDSRHPQKVEFTSELTEDLARRDFTVNAMAYSPELGLMDPFGGQEALERGVIVCVGDPHRRFGEDALRILRGLRFSAVLGFRIDDGAARAMMECAHLIKRVSAERVSEELSKLILGKAVDQVFDKFGDVIKTAAPGIQITAVDHAPRILPVRLGLLFPVDTEEFLRRLKYDNHTIKSAAALARLYKGKPPKGDVEIKRLLSREGEETARLYFQTLSRLEEVDNILQSGQCCTIRQLAVNGGDLIEAGVDPGREVGKVLDRLLELVIDGKIENRKDILLDFVQEEGV